MSPLRAYAKKNSPEGLRARRGGGKDALHKNPKASARRTFVPVGTGTNYPWTGPRSECMIPYQKASTGGTNATRATNKGEGGK